jgi:hypothetical protein
VGRSVAFGSAEQSALLKATIATVRLTWVLKSLPASHHVVDLILVPSGG